MKEENVQIQTRIDQVILDLKAAKTREAVQTAMNKCSTMEEVRSVLMAFTPFEMTCIHWKATDLMFWGQDPSILSKEDVVDIIAEEIMDMRKAHKDMEVIEETEKSVSVEDKTEEYYPSQDTLIDTFRARLDELFNIETRGRCMRAITDPDDEKTIKFSRYEAEKRMELSKDIFTWVVSRPDFKDTSLIA